MDKSADRGALLLDSTDSTILPKIKKNTKKSTKHLVVSKKSRTFAPAFEIKPVG